MDITVLEDLAFQLDPTQVLQKLHVREDSKQVSKVLGMAAEAQAIGRPKAIYRLAFIDSKESDHVVVEGTKFTSRILRVNLERPQRVFAYVATAGQELAAWTASHDDMLDNYWADALTEGVLHAARGTLDSHLKARYEIPQLAEMNPGSLADWPIREQRPLFRMLGDAPASIGVELLDSLLMTPAKTVSGILFPTEETFASCQLCPNEGCPNRRAPYDTGLLKRKYGED